MDREEGRPRDKNGRYLPGHPGEGGRPKGISGELLAREILLTDGKAQTLIKEFLQSESQDIRLRCFTFLWDHAFGKARQREEIAFDRNAINVILRLARPGDPSPEDEPGSIADARRPALNPVDRDGD